MNFKLRSLVAATLAGSMLMGFGANAMADSTDDILNALIAKGVLTEEEGALLQKGRTGEKEAAAAKKLTSATIKEKDGAFVLSSGDGKNTMALTGRMHFDYKQNDIGSFGDSTIYPYNADADTKSTGDHFNMRRARIGIKGRLGGMADYLLLANINGSSILDEAYLDVNKFEPLGLKFGKFKQPMNLEIQTSSNNIDEIERSYVSQNVPEKKMGAMLHGEPKGLTYAGSIFQNNDSALSQQDDRMSFAGRGTVNFAELMDNKEMVLHAGINGYDSEYQIRPESTGNTSDSASSTTRGTIVAFNSGGQGLANIFRAQIGGEASTTADYHAQSPSTSTVKNKKAGLESIFAYKNFKVQGEYSAAKYDAATTKVGAADETISADVDTWYAEVAWILTGESYADIYKKGAFGAMKPKSPFDMEAGNGWGLWEASFRVDAFDVTNGNITGTTSDATRFQGGLNKYSTTTGDSNATGKIDTCSNKSGTSSGVTTVACATGVSSGAKSYTAGLKWVWNPNLVWKLNYTRTNFENATYPIDVGPAADRKLTNAARYNSFDHENLVMVRGQFSF